MYLYSEVAVSRILISCICCNRFDFESQLIFVRELCNADKACNSYYLCLSCYKRRQILYNDSLCELVKEQTA